MGSEEIKTEIPYGSPFGSPQRLSSYFRRQGGTPSMGASLFNTAGYIATDYKDSKGNYLGTISNGPVDDNGAFLSTAYNALNGWTYSGVINDKNACTYTSIYDPRTQTAVVDTNHNGVFDEGDEVIDLSKPNDVEK
jgi:hypothetical protein